LGLDAQARVASGTHQMLGWAEETPNFGQPLRRTFVHVRDRPGLVF
jgi:hypothetical protein